MRKISLIVLLFLSLSTPAWAVDVTWEDKITGGSFTADDANEVKDAVNSKANLSRVTWVTATAYTASNTMVAHKGHVFVCTVDHTSGATTEPGEVNDWATVWKYHGEDLYLGIAATAADSDKLGGVAAADYQLSLGTVGAAGLYPIEETVLGVTGKGIVGNWKMFYSNAAGGNFEQFDIGTSGYSLVSQGTAGAPQWLIRPQTITCTGTDKVSAFDITTGLFTCSADEEGLGGSDASAIHDDTAGEIAAITEKSTPVSADLIVIEDSAASNAKKRVQIGNLPGVSPVTLGTDAAAIFSLTGQQLDLDSQTANYILAAPNGSAGDPTFRALVAADIPILAAANISIADAGYLLVGTTVETALQELAGKLADGVDGAWGLSLKNNTTTFAPASGYDSGYSVIGNNPYVYYSAANHRLQLWDAQLDTWGGVTPGTGVAAALANALNGTGGLLSWGGDAGTPSAIVLTNGTGLPVARVGNFTTGQSQTGAYSLSAANSYNSTIFYDDTEDLDLPAAVAGMNLCVYVTGTNLTTIDPNGTDVMVVDGVANTGGDAVTIAGVAGNFLCLVADAANHWVTMGSKGTITAL